MKISALKPLNSFSLQRNENKEYKSNVNHNINSNEIMKNSVAEMLGRSQIVSFKGTNQINGDFFEHRCNTLTGVKENIFYNKKDGSFTHQILNRDNSLKSQIEFYPLLGKEIETQVENGKTTKITKTATSTITEKFDINGNQTLYKEIGTDGSKKTIVTELKKHRRIIKQEKNGQVLTPQVIDLRTNRAVVSGEIAHTRYYDKATGFHITENIVTGQIVKKEKYKDNRDLVSLVEYSERTSVPIKEIYLDTRNGGYIETNYTDFGVKKSFIKTSKDKRTVVEYLYADDGKTITSQVQYEHDKKKNLVCETIYIPGTQIIQTQMEYSGEDCTVYNYRKNPNVPSTAEVHVGGRLVEQIIFQKDGETYSYQQKFYVDGSRMETFYNMAGCPTNSNYFTKDKFKYKTCEYYPHTEGVKLVTEFDRTTGDIKETYYNDMPNTVSRVMLKTYSGRLKEVLDYNIDGKTLYSKKSYNFDGSYTKYIYDKDGNVIDKTEYDSLGKRKPAYNYTNDYSGSSSSYNYRYRRQTESTSQVNSKSSGTISIEEAVDSILAVTSKSKFSLKEIDLNQLNVLAEYLGLDDSSILLKLNLEENKNTYRTLAKISHPDKHSNDSNYSLYEKIFQIINSLHSK